MFYGGFTLMLVVAQFTFHCEMPFHAKFLFLKNLKLIVEALTMVSSE